MYPYKYIRQMMVGDLDGESNPFFSRFLIVRGMWKDEKPTTVGIDLMQRLAPTSINRMVLDWMLTNLQIATKMKSESVWEEELANIMQGMQTNAVDVLDFVKRCNGVHKDAFKKFAIQNQVIFYFCLYCNLLDDKGKITPVGGLEVSDPIKLNKLFINWYKLTIGDPNDTA